jgi:hypothetical protein
MVSTGRGTRSSVTSSARDLPDAGSGERKARRGVESQMSIRCVWAIQRVWATRA